MKYTVFWKSVKYENQWNMVFWKSVKYGMTPFCALSLKGIFSYEDRGGSQSHECVIMSRQTPEDFLESMEMSRYR